MKRLLAVATVLTMTAAMLAGCGSSAQNAASTASEPAVQESVQAPAESQAAADSEAPAAQTDSDKVYRSVSASFCSTKRLTPQQKVSRKP